MSRKAVKCEAASQIAFDENGALLRVSGPVEGAGEGEVTFRVRAHDEQEQVCEGSIRRSGSDPT